MNLYQGWLLLFVMAAYTAYLLSRVRSHSMKKNLMTGSVAGVAARVGISEDLNVAIQVLDSDGDTHLIVLSASCAEELGVRIIKYSAHAEALRLRREKGMGAVLEPTDVINKSELPS